MDGVAVGAHHFQSAFHGFGARVGEKGALQTADLREALGQRALVLVVIQVGAVDDQPGLFADDFYDAGMGVSQRIHPDAGQEIQVAAARRVIHITAFAAGDGEGMAGVVLQHVIPLQVHDRLGGVIRDGGKDAFHLFIIAAGKLPQKPSRRLSRSLSYR